METEIVLLNGNKILFRKKQVTTSSLGVKLYIRTLFRVEGYP